MLRLLVWLCSGDTVLQVIFGGGGVKIFVGCWLVLQVKVGKVASFVGKIFVVQYSTMKTKNILPHENYPLYGSSSH